MRSEVNTIGAELPGAGNGHGVGLCLTGGINMAFSGRDHEEILMHNHDSHHDNKDAHSENDHQPVPCLIQTLNLSVPRALTTVKLEVPSDVANLFVTLPNSILITNDEFYLCYVPIPPGDPLDDGVINNLPPRAPPC